MTSDDAHGAPAQQQAGHEQTAEEHQATDLRDLGVAGQDPEQQPHDGHQQHDPAHQHADQGGAGFGVGNPAVLVFRMFSFFQHAAVLNALGDARALLFLCMNTMLIGRGPS